MNKFKNFIHGRFGKKVLNRKYREMWVGFWYCLGGMIAFILFFMGIQLLTWLSDLINYVCR